MQALQKVLDMGINQKADRSKIKEGGSVDVQRTKACPRIYVVLPVHNRIEVTKKFIECLKRQTYRNYHLVLVDDGSTDGTAEYVKRNIKNLTVLKGDGSMWWAGALDAAYRYLVGVSADDDDIVWINNDDSVFDDDYFEKVANDDALGPNTLVISPGKSLDSDFVERGFAIDWLGLKIKRLKEGEPPDALTTRGLYMFYSTYVSLGPMHPWLLPHYLSDLEYTIRGKRRGMRLVVSRKTFVYVDRSSTGMHEDDSTTLREFFYNNLVSKKTAFNVFYWGNFVLLASPWRYKLINLALVYIVFLKRLKDFLLHGPPSGSTAQRTGSNG